jgi:hypothetical protein
MTDSGFDIDGINSLQEEFGDRIDDWSEGGTVFVGSGVEYSVYLEFGTSKMNPKPFFRPVVNDARIDTEGFLDRNTQTTVSEIDSADKLVRTLALAIERRVKEIITKKGLIDTGTLRASIIVVDSQSEFLAAEDVTV